MEPFRVHILGCGSAKPSPRHNPSSQVVELRGHLWMVDCGEGTQLQLARAHVRFQRVNSVFITHLHGDHCFGLIGMVSSFALLGRTTPLHIFAPAPFGELLRQQMRVCCGRMDYEVITHDVDTKEKKVIYEDKVITVQSIPLMHRMPCCGFLFTEKTGQPHIRPDMMAYLNIPLSQINNIKAGADWVTADGKVVKNSQLVTPPHTPRSYAYCSDTHYMPDTLPEMIENVNLLYHEGTYADDAVQLAEKYYHSTARQAALVAKKAHAGKLMLGHFSGRYEDEKILLRQAQEEFANTILANENMVVEVT